MRLSEYRALADEVFGSHLARAYERDTVLTELGGLTALEAFESDVPVREVWVALCDAHDVPERLRWESQKDAKKRR
ncbi:DUF3046 domain-containing protein [Dermabacteraceae bacterium TAE3-ERU27]|nr:DUF3046 domain-containing protein [Dermabacteraceae bacterium TAE3-ERU27]